MAGRKKQAKNRRPSSGVAVRLIIMLAVVAAIVFGVAIFFKVTTIEVQGNTLYSAEDVIAASGIEPGDNLLLVNKATTAGNILAALPYVEEVRGIVRSLPDTVVIQIQESEASFAVQTDVNTTWLVNSRGKALEKVEGELPEGQPQILGVSVKAPAAGMTVTAVEQSRLDAALAVLSGLDGTGILEHVASINVEKDYDIIVQYDDRYTIRLGGTDDLAYKIQYLTSILAELSDFQAGTIDLTDAANKKATFQPRRVRMDAEKNDDFSRFLLTAEIFQYKIE